MLDFDQAQEYMWQLIDEMPPDILKGLNGGVSLVPRVLNDKDGLLILGQYHVDPYGLGRYITINYGSIAQVYGHASPNAFKKKLEEVLKHELVHHLESLAGDRSLEIQDEIDKERMLDGNYNINDIDDVDYIDDGDEEGEALDMHVASAMLTFHICHAASLKDKRQVARSIIDGARHRFNASIAEVATQNTHKILTIGMAAVADSASFANVMIDEIIRYTETAAQNLGAELVKVDIYE